MLKYILCCFGDITKDNCPKIINIARTLRYPPPLWGAIMPGLLGKILTSSREAPTLALSSISALMAAGIALVPCKINKAITKL